MNALESPLEALALDYLSYGVLTAVNNVWAWFAVITAAVSFWKIRASSSPPDRLIGRSCDVPSTSASSAPTELSEETAEEAELASSAPTKKAAVRVLERQGSTKLKFSLYYREEEEEEEEGAESEELVGCAAAAVEVTRMLGRRCDDWERMMAVKKGDLGWYKW